MHESLQVSVYWALYVNLTRNEILCEIVLKMHLTCSDSCMHVGPPLHAHAHARTHAHWLMPDHKLTLCACYRRPPHRPAHFYKPQSPPMHQPHSEKKLYKKLHKTTSFLCLLMVESCCILSTSFRWSWFLLLWSGGICMHVGAWNLGMWVGRDMSLCI